jgi:hypothetical protein
MAALQPTCALIGVSLGGWRTLGLGAAPRVAGEDALRIGAVPYDGPERTVAPVPPLSETVMTFEGDQCNS